MALFKKKMKAAAVVPVSHEDIEFRPDDFTLCDDADAVRIDSNYASQSYWKMCIRDRRGLHPRHRKPGLHAVDDIHGDGVLLPAQTLPDGF